MNRSAKGGIGRACTMEAKAFSFTDDALWTRQGRWELRRAVAYGAGANLGLAWVGAFDARALFEERFQRRSMPSFPRYCRRSNFDHR
jgi:hypothetical protein